MRLVFAGTPAFAAAALDALLGAGHEIVLVLTRPDRPAGRGMAPAASDVKRLAEARQLRLAQPESLSGEPIQSELRDAGAAAMVVAAYGLILPGAILESFPLGCINIHASLLPRWRGAAPIQRALLAGDRVTGISIMQMDQGLDTGPVYLEEHVAIAADDTFGSLHDKLAAVAGPCIVRALEEIARGILKARAQPPEGASYARKIAKQEARLNWSKSATQLDREIRAFNPVPGAHTALSGVSIKIWRARPVESLRGNPGEVLKSEPGELVVACGNGALQLVELQRAGGKRLGVAEFVRGMSPSPGQRFDG